MDKTAEEILFNKIPKDAIPKPYQNLTIEAMQAYHEAKMKEELISFCKSYFTIYNAEETEKLVNEYLKHRNNE